MPNMLTIVHSLKIVEINSERQWGCIVSASRRDLLQGGGLAGGEGIHRDSEASVKAEGYPSPGYTLTLRAGHLKLRGVVLIISFCSGPSILHQSSSDYLNLLTIQHPFSPPVQDLSLAPDLAGNSPPYDLRHVACLPRVHHKSVRWIFA